jgi:threonine synthase
MAKKIGVPFGNLCAGVNANDFTHRAFSTGDVRRIDEPMKPSLSDAINIQLPYNLERLLFYLTDQDHAKVKAWYEQLEHKSQGGGGSGGGSFDLTADDNWLAKLQSEFRSAKVLDDSLCDTIQRILDVYGYWVDPHTGVAFGAAEQLGYLSVASSGSTTATANNNPVAVMATASPCKFQAAMTKAVGGDRWSDYETHHFPARGRDLQDQEERPPNRYVSDPDKTLEENQLVWEAKTRALIAKLGR